MDRPFYEPHCITSAEQLAVEQSRCADLRVVNGYAYWIAQHNGRHQLMRVRLGQQLADAVAVTPADIDVRSRVQGYGGGAYCVTPDHVVYVCDAREMVLLRVAAGTGAQPSPVAAGTFGDLDYDTTSGLIYAVCELDGSPQPKTAICAILPGDAGVATVRMVVEGADFYASPRISPCGQQLCWVEWSFPDMPWDTSELHLAQVNDAAVVASAPVFAKPGASVIEPAWSADGALYFLQDTSGWWSLTKRAVDGRISHYRNAELEFGFPPYRLGVRSYGVTGLPGGVSVVAFAFRKGKLVLCAYADEDSAPCILSERFSESAGLFSAGGWVYCLAACDDEPAALVQLPFATLAETPSASPSRPARASRTERLALPTLHGTIHAVLHRPPGVHDAPGALIVDVHGGPTGIATGAHNFLTKYWLAQGYFYLEVNHRGSTGFGRAYRDALRGHWGVDDVVDCEAAVAWLISRGIVDATRIAIRGASAGGYTALRAATVSTLFAASTCAYGVGDLAALSARTHKFESRYLDGLIGDPGVHAHRYADRSPINASRLHCPVLLLHGSDDKVVPVEQTRVMLDQVRRTDGRALHCQFFNEGHGFLDPLNRLIALRLETGFYRRFLARPGDAPAEASFGIDPLLANGRCAIERIGL